jgi:uncharacterized DUF497 family protein
LQAGTKKGGADGPAFFHVTSLGSGLTFCYSASRMRTPAFIEEEPLIKNSLPILPRGVFQPGESSLDNVYKNVYKISMKYTWDDSKRRANMKKHRLDLADAEKVFAGATFTFEDKRFDYGEQRWVTMGLLGLAVVVVVHTESEEVIHVISIRKAEKTEQALYYANL